MKWPIGLLLILGLGFLTWLTMTSGNNPAQSPLISSGANGGLIELTSTAFKAGDSIPDKHTCQAENISPPLTLSGVPAGTESLALIMDDPDAPGGTFTHWVVWNLPVDQSQIKEGALPQAAQEGVTSYGQAGYNGPCPPSGEHRYYFKVFALSSKLDLPATTTADDLIRVMEGKILEETQLMGIYAQN